MSVLPQYALCEVYAPAIDWLVEREWTQLRGTLWSRIVMAVLKIDVTSHPIYRPLNEQQVECFSGHRHALHS